MTQGFIIDMHGVIHNNSGEMMPGSAAFLNGLIQRKIPFVCLTNNSRRTPREIVIQLNQMGIELTEQHIFTSATATGMFLASQKPHGTAYVLGEEGLILSLHQHGFAIVDHKPDYVVVGESSTLTLERIDLAIDLIIDGAKFIATNLDPPSSIKGWLKPGISAVVAMLEEASGKKAYSIGKPNPIMIRGARKFMQSAAKETTIIGDTMETDILGGIQMGYRTYLVLTGTSSKEDSLKFAYRPDKVFDSIADIPFEV